MKQDTAPGPVFISYSHDSIEHAQAVLALSNKLREDGIDAVLDQYEASPPEGWPRWMDREIRKAQFVLMVCTEPYYRRVMGEEEPGHGKGVAWEGNIIYQHLYDSGSANSKFVPVLLDDNHEEFIPIPVKGTSRYVVSDAAGDAKLHARLLGRAPAEKPALGKPRPLEPKEVKTDVAAFLAAPIDVDLWNVAKWKGAAFFIPERLPPILGLAFENRDAAQKIFQGWHDRYGNNDDYEELRISIIEGDIPGQEPGYSVHVGPDYENLIKRYRHFGFNPIDGVIFSISRFHRMNPDPGSTNLAQFKEAYRAFKVYVLAPVFIEVAERRLTPFFDLGIRKSRIFLRHVDEIGPNDVDTVVFKDHPPAR